MRTMHPVLKRGGLFWDRDILPAELLRARLGRLQAMVGAHGDDAWLFYGDVERHGHVTYASNFLPRTRSALVMVPRDGEPSILAAISSRDLPPAKTLTWIDDIRPFGNVSKAVLAWLSERGLAGARLGLVGVAEGMEQADWRQIDAGLAGARISVRSPEIERLRESKDDFERAALRKTSDAMAAALDFVPTVLRAGMTVRQLCAGVDRQLRLKGAEDVRILVAAGAGCGAALGLPSDMALNEGDGVMLFVRAQVQRYWSEAARTFVIGRAPAPLRDMAERARAALGAMRKAVRPGAAVSVVYDAGDQALEGSALQASARRYGYGNGIGLDAEEAPGLEAGSARRIAGDSSLALRTIVHGEGLGVAVGQVVLAGDAGVEELIDAPALIEVLH